MPHFIIDCSDNVLNISSPELVMQNVYNSAESTNLFEEGDIKVRINAYKYFKLGKFGADFIHVFAYILEGRDIHQKKFLSKTIVRNLKSIFQDVEIISINIMDFERTTYCNKLMV